MITTVHGVVENIRYRNEENGYTVVDISCEEELITCVGIIPSVNEGETVTVTGNYEEHKDFGLQVKISSISIELPSKLADIEKYLASGLIKGVGPTTATAIVRQFGTDTFSIMEFNPHRLMEISGIGEQKSKQIAISFREVSSTRNAMIFLKACGISTNFAVKICKTYGDKVQEKIEDNPYCMVDDIDGIGFSRADEIARNMGMDTNSPFRIKAAIKYILNDAASQNGHLYLPKDQLFGQVSQLLNNTETDFDDILSEMEFENQVVSEFIAEDIVVYLSYFYYIETNTAFNLVKLMKNAKILPVDVNIEIDMYESDCNIKLAEMQRQAIMSAINNGVAVITGGPGTGKTTIINCIIKLLKRRGLTVELAAPTGRAAKRMSEATGEEAKTIHRLLEYGKKINGAGMSFTRDQINPLTSDAVIIDEMSMIDLSLMCSLLKALTKGTRLIMVGDADQLPSVGAGNVLRDIIKSEIIPVTKLTEVYRQSEKSLIVHNAHLINNGKMPVINNKDTDFLFLKKESASEIANTIIELCSRRIPNYYNIDPITDIQILVPMKKNVAGVNDLNLKMQKTLNPYSINKNEYKYGDVIFREGDKVMQIKNNYDIEWIKPLVVGEERGTGIFNGDCGIIESINNEDRMVLIRFDDGRYADYEFNMIDELMQAYAVTVHKSQGCEFNYVILPLVGGPPMLYSRNLLYTAVTRAKKMVLLVGRESVIEQMINNNYTAVRYSSLAQRIKDNAEV